MWRARTPSCSTATLRSPMPPNDRGARRAPPSDRSRRRPPPRCRFPQRDAVARRARQGIHTRPARPDGAARRLVAKGSRAWDTAAAAQRLLSQREDGLLFVYLPECDRAGHAHGWMSEQYLEAAAQVDAGVGLLSGWTDDAGLIITAGHGGGGGDRETARTSSSRQTSHPAERTPAGRDAAAPAQPRRFAARH